MTTVPPRSVNPISDLIHFISIARLLGVGVVVTLVSLPLRPTGEVVDHGILAHLVIGFRQPAEDLGCGDQATLDAVQYGGRAPVYEPRQVAPRVNTHAVLLVLQRRQFRYSVHY